MSGFTLVLNGLRHYRRSHAAVFAGVVIATAVLTGALIMGDSVDRTLRGIALARLGGVHQALYQPNRFVASGLAEALGGRVNAGTAPLLQLRGMALRQSADSGAQTQVNQVNVLGVDDRFWALMSIAPPELAEDAVVVNERLAEALGVSAGGRMSLRVDRPSRMALDAPLSPRNERRFSRMPATVAAVLPDSGPGRFSLVPSQVAPYNVFIRLDRLQQLTESDGLANVMIAGGGVSAGQLREAMRAAWKLEDVGLRLREGPDGIAQLESERIFLDRAVADAALALPGATGTLAYLVNSISAGDRSTPYSFAVAGPAPDGMADDSAIVNEWLAQHLGIQAGDMLEVAYYELTAMNEFVERRRSFTVAEVRGMGAMLAERELMPEFPGLSDVESCSDWDIGMPMDDEALRDEDNEAYWDTYRQTPKIIVTLKAGQEMWANRFGGYTAVRFDNGTARVEEVRAALRESIAPADVGLQFAPVREQALQAVDRAMDFGALFLGMSFFLIVAALILTALLFTFGVQQRAEELGTLLALGFRTGRIRSLLTAEAGCVALAGSVTGALGGAAYARLLILGLSRFWEGAVAHTAIRFHAVPATLAEGALLGFACALAAIALAVRRQTRQPARFLLSGESAEGGAARGADGWKRGLFPPLLGVVASAGWAACVLHSKPHNIALPFFGVGAVLLLSGLGFWRAALSLLATGPAEERLTLCRLGIQQAARRPGRSMAVVALLASGLFLVLSVASMRENLASRAHERASGTGGFELYAESAIPLQEPLLGALEETGASAVALRVREGGDASCLNLNYSDTPRLLGIDPDAMARLNAFEQDGAGGRTWRLLERELPDGAVPALVGDTDTAMWGLMAKADPETGDIRTYLDESGAEVPLKLMGSLPMRLSVFQGTLLISADNFTRLYPSESGFRVFLVDVPIGAENGVSAGLRQQWERHGLDVVPTLERLRQFYTVESTYLAMFLVLGGLGVTLGGLGMGIVMLRNLFERRAELAMLDAVGFDRRAIRGMLVIEHVTLLVAGVGVGTTAAAIAVLPGILISGTSAPPALMAAVLGLVAMVGAACMAAALYIGGPAGFDALRDE